MAGKKRKRRPTPPAPPVARKPPRAAGRPAGPTRRELERKAVAQRDRRDALRRRLATAGVVTAVLAAVGAYVVFQQRGDAALRRTLTGGTCEVDTEADPISGGDGHVAAPRYRVNPPAGGDHEPSAARAGVYRGTAVPPDGRLVHAQEHGYVVAWHRPDLPADQRAALEALKTRHEGDVIVAERASLPTAVAATAWGQRLLCDAVEPKVLDRFVAEHVGNGPEDVPRG